MGKTRAVSPHNSGREVVPVLRRALRVSYSLSPSTASVTLYGTFFVDAVIDNTMSSLNGHAVNELVEAKHQLQLRRVLARWSRYDLIAIDEVGYVPQAEVGAESLPAHGREAEERSQSQLTVEMLVRESLENQRQVSTLSTALSEIQCACFWQSDPERRSVTPTPREFITALGIASGKST
jgi:hypothetical protein